MPDILNCGDAWSCRCAIAIKNPISADFMAETRGVQKLMLCIILQSDLEREILKERSHLKGALFLRAPDTLASSVLPVRNICKSPRPSSTRTELYFMSSP